MSLGKFLLGYYLGSSEKRKKRRRRRIILLYRAVKFLTLAPFKVLDCVADHSGSKGTNKADSSD